MAEVLVTDDGWRVEQVSVVLDLRRPGLPMYRATHLGYHIGDYPTITALRDGIGDDVFVRLRPQRPPSDSDQ